MLKHMLRIAIALLCFYKPYTNAKPIKQKIVVVGAGLSGLTTAYRLYNLGYDVEVYEARKERVGGRTFSIYINDHVVELGGKNLFDGGNAANICSLATELGLTIKSSLRHRKPYVYVNDGTAFDISAALEHYAFTAENLRPQLEQLCTSSSSMKEVIQQLFSDNEPLARAFSIRLAGYEGSPVERLSPLYIETLYHMILGGLCAVHPSNEDMTIQMAHIEEGNNLIALRLADRLAPHVHLDSPLQAISTTSTGKYLLTFNENTSIEADIVVLTMPCSVYHDIIFDPTVLPTERLQAIQAVQYGTNAKIIVPSPTDTNEGPSYTNGRMITINGYDNYNAIMYYVENHGNFTPNTLQATFDRDLPTLMLSCTPSLPLAAPVYAQDKAFATYLGPVGYAWPNDPYAQGSYSCIGAGQEVIFTQLEDCAGFPVKTLFAPLNNTLFFAGEHTCTDMSICGTMEAAVESGERSAHIIAALHPNA